MLTDDRCTQRTPGGSHNDTYCQEDDGNHDDEDEHQTEGTPACLPLVVVRRRKFLGSTSSIYCYRINVGFDVV